MNPVNSVSTLNTQDEMFLEMVSACVRYVVIGAIEAETGVMVIVSWIEVVVISSAQFDTMAVLLRNGYAETGNNLDISYWLFLVTVFHIALVIRTGLPGEESVRMTEDRDKWRQYVHGWPTLGSRTAKEQDRTCN